jgi:hypothetical protein
MTIEVLRSHCAAKGETQLWIWTVVNCRFKSDACQTCGIPEERKSLVGSTQEHSRQILFSVTYPAVIDEGNI